MAHLPAATHLGLQAHTRAPPDVYGPNTLRAIDLVATDGHQVNVVLLHIDRHLAHCLSCIGVEKHLVLAADAPDLLHVLEHTCNEQSR